MTKRKLSIEVEMDGDKINSIECLGRKILIQGIIGKIAEKYLYSIQN